MQVSSSAVTPPRPYATFVAVDAVDSLRQMDHESAAKDRYIRAASEGAAAAGDRLRNLGKDAEARQAYEDAAAVGGMYIAS